MVLIESPPTTPFHVCKFCNKQLDTRCEPVTTQHTLTGTPVLATVTGQPIGQLASSAAHLTNLVSPVMASLPQVVGTKLNRC